MSDSDLRNLYESVRRGDEYHAPKREGELYREVADVRRALQNPETAAVVQRDKEKNPTPNFGQRRTPKQDNAIKELIEDWVASAGYANMGGQVTALVKSAVDGYVNWEELYRFVVSKAKNEVGLPVESGLVDIDSILKQQLRKFVVSEEHIENVYTTLFGAAFAESTVAVGRGELIITLLTNCTKGQVGDVEFIDRDPTDGIKLGPGKDAIQVEVKTGRGRAISGRGGGFKNANIAIETAIMGGLKVDPEIAASGKTYKVTDDDGIEIHVSPVTKTVKGKEKIIGFNTIEGMDQLLSIEQFINEIKKADKHMGKHNWFTDYAKELADLLSIEEAGKSDEEVRVVRHYATLACMLLGYSAKGKHFKYVLLVKQAGKNANVNDTAYMADDSFKAAAFVDCTSLANIYNQMKGNGPLHMDRGGRYTDGAGGKRKALDGEGVYIGYKGSNTNIDALAASSTYSSDRNRDLQANYTVPSKRK